MIRKSRVLGLVLAAMLTMGVLAAAASAAEFHSSEAHTSLVATATSEQVFKAGETEVKCTKAGTKFSPHTLSTKTTSEVTVTVTAETGTCTAAGFPVHVDFATGECDYRFTADGTVHLLCKAGGSVTLTPTFFGSVCTIHVYPGTYGTVTYTNNATETDVNVHATATNITYNTTGGGGLCGTEGHMSDGTYEGDATVEGRNTLNEKIPIWFT